jgi:hypothetical protein
MSLDLFFHSHNRSWARGPAPLWKGDDIKATTGTGKFIMHGLAVATGISLATLAATYLLPIPNSKPTLAP